MENPPRPRRPAAIAPPPAPLPRGFDVEVPVTVGGSTVPPAPRELPAALPAELDERTRNRVAVAIAKAISAELGNVRISSVPPESAEPAPRSSMRVAADVGGKVGKWGIKWGVLGSGAVALIGQVIVWTMKPEYAAPLAQALKIIGAAIAAAAGGAPSGDVTP
jgi:hypothetical protein